MYGSLDAGGAYVSNSAGSALFKFNQSNMQPDRWGFKGVEDLGGGPTFRFSTGERFFHRHRNFRLKRNHVESPGIRGTRLAGGCH
nr:porin [Pandoraea soli]